MSSHFQRVAKKSLIATVAGLAASLAIANVAVPLLGGTVDGLGLLMCIVCPIAVGGPASVLQFHQAGRLEQARNDLVRAHARLHVLHQDLNDAHAALTDKARRDGMTGLLNHENFMAALQGLGNAGRAGTLLFIDADHFKAINDTFGHSVGDAALKALAATIAGTIRADDIAGRLGGEEFAVFLTDTDVEAAARIAEQIRSGIAALRIECGQDRPVTMTVSIGAVSGDRQFLPQHLWKEADRRLYAAKHAGRNRIVGPAPFLVAA